MNAALPRAGASGTLLGITPSRRQAGLQEFENDPEQSALGMEEALFAKPGGSFKLELRAVYYLHQQLGAQLSALQDEFFPQANWQISAVEVRPFSELETRYAKDTVWGILDFIEQSGGAFVYLDEPALTLLTGLANADPHSDDTMGYVETYLQHFTQAFSSAWHDVMPFEVQALPSPVAPPLSDLAPMFPGLNPNTPMVTTAFRVSLAGQTQVARVTLALPQAYLLSVAESLRAIGESTFSGTDTSHFYERLAYVEDLPVPISVLLGKAQMSVGELHGLEEGDVIPLDSSLGEPLEVRMGNTLLRGKPGTSADGRHLAVQIMGGFV
jgi:flagellar motor switch/type III secretory pathway protein FliN